MDIFLYVLFATVFAILAGDMIWYSLTFDQLIQFEYQNFHEQWEKDGKPYGFFWTPPDQHEVTEVRTRVVSLGLMFSTPKWINTDLKAKNLLYRLRILAATFSLITAMIGMMIAMMIFYMMITGDYHKGFNMPYSTLNSFRHFPIKACK